MNRMNVRIWMTASQRRTLGLFCCMLVMLAGCTAGTVCMQNGTLEPLCQFCIRYGIRSETNNIFWGAVRQSGGILLTGFCLGLCAAGQPFLCLLLALQGFSTGCLLTDLIGEGFSQMILLRFVLTAVYAIAASFLLLLGLREAMRLSCVWIRACVQETEPLELRRRLRLYGVRFAVLFLLLLAAGGIYTLLLCILL